MVLADDRQITVGTCGELRAERRPLQVEVVYKTLLDARLRPGNRPRFRIGVKRLKDIEIREPTDRKNRGLRRWLQLSQPTASGTSSMIHLSLIVLLLIVVGTLYALSAANPQNKEKGDAAKNQPAWAWLTAKETDKGVSPEIVKRLQRPLTPQAIFDVLAAPAVIRHLKLSETQQTTLRQIAQVTGRRSTSWATAATPKRGSCPAAGTTLGSGLAANLAGSLPRTTRSVEVVGRMTAAASGIAAPCVAARV